MKKTYLDYFKEIAEIPHGSGNTAQIRDYCVDFAKSHSLEFYTDELNNVVIRKPATKGYEQHEAVVLQGHLDMVCEKDPDVEFDFTKDALRLRTEGDFLMATGTTLGGDDGIAIAMMLSILSSDSIEHPQIECVFTTDEETGMYGAEALDPSQVHGRRLINIDSEDEGIFTVGCAGGTTCEVTLNINEQNPDENDWCCIDIGTNGDLSEYDLSAEGLSTCALESGEIFAQITVSGLIGGHSGVEINKGRQNSNVVLFGLLSEMVAQGIEFKICYICGGSKDNVITNKTVCIVIISSEEICVLSDMISEYVKKVRIDTDPDLAIDLCVISHEFQADMADSVKPVNLADLSVRTSKILPYNCSKKLISMLSAYPNGIQKMSNDIKDLPQTSLNFAVALLEDGHLTLRFSVRSSVTDEKELLVKDLEKISLKHGAKFSRYGDYPAWEYRKDSPLRDTMVAVFKDMYGKPPKVEVIHAGLECGLLSEKLPGLDAVSIGPDLFDIHSPKERLSLSSAERVYEFILRVLKSLN